MSTQLLHIALWCFAVVAVQVAAAPQPQEPPPMLPRVDLPCGPVFGKRDELFEVNGFLGIPYASTPPERFIPPKDPAPWKEPLSATEFKPTCPSIFRDPVTSFMFNTPPLQESEDCLYINVFVPARPAPPGGRAIAFWIYGGNNEFGGSQYRFYNGKYLAAYEDIIVVSFNYRTSYLGFTMSPDMPLHQQNLGYLDMRKALDWVQKNIAFFGGNPQMVTIFGISSGAIAVKDLMAHPPKPLPFRAAYFQSREPGLFQSHNSWERLAKEMKCPESSRERLECMARQDPSKVHAVMLEKMIRFAPVYDKKTAAKSLLYRIQHGKAAKIPVLDSAMLNDAGALLVYHATNSPALNKDPKATAEYAIKMQDGDLTKLDYVKAYDVGPQPDPERTRMMLSKILTDGQFFCPAEGLTHAVAATGQKAYRFVTNFTAPNARPFPNPPLLDAFHTADIPQLFGTYPRKGATEQQIELSRYMMRVFANFVKDPEKGPGWPDVSQGKVQLLGIDGSCGGSPVDEAVFGSRCALFRDAIVKVGG